MKKRYLIPLVAVTSFTGLVVLSNAILYSEISDCNAGNLSICQELADKDFLGKFWTDKVTNEAFPAMQAKRTEAKAAAAAKRAEDAKK